MKAVLIETYGGREVMKLAEVPRPCIQENEILIRIRAAGVNPVDVKIREGLLKTRMPNELPIILGWDAAGLVEEVGSQIQSFKKGDEVFAYCRKEKIHDGTYAEFTAVEEKHLALKPKSFSFEEAASIPLAGLTAYQSLFESLKLQAGEKILIHAGAGGVGGFAIQLAKNAGAYVITTSSSRHHDYVQSLGADEIIDYREEDFVAAIRQKYPQGLDAVFDTVGEETQKKSADVLKAGGRLTSILALDETYFRSRGLNPSYVFVRPVSDQLRTLCMLIEAGNLRTRVSHTLPLSEAARSHELIESRRTEGKIVLRL